MCNRVMFPQTMKDSEGIIPNESEDFRPPAELYPYLTNAVELYEGKEPPHNCVTLPGPRVFSRLLSPSRPQVELLWAHAAARLWSVPSEPLHGAAVCVPSAADSAAPPWQRGSGPSPGPGPHTPARVPAGMAIPTRTASFRNGTF